MLAGGVSQQLGSALDRGAPADLDAYVAYLDGLPASWYDTDDGDAGQPLDDEAFDVLGPADDDGPAAALVRAMLAEQSPPARVLARSSSGRSGEPREAPAELGVDLVEVPTDQELVRGGRQRPDPDAEGLEGREREEAHARVLGDGRRRVDAG